MSATPTQLAPDIEAIAVAYLLEHDAVADLVDERVYTNSGSQITAPYATVFRAAGGARARHHVDQAVLQVEGWADDRSTARDVCETALAALHDLPGWLNDLGVVSGVTDLIGTRPLPAREDERWHFAAEVLVTAYPHRSGYVPLGS